jgi:hypothetical protein
MPYGAAVLRRNNKRRRSMTVSAGERTPDYGHTPASLVNGVGGWTRVYARVPRGHPQGGAHVHAPLLDDRQKNTVLIIVLN